MEGNRISLSYKDDKSFIIEVSIAGTRELIDLRRGPGGALAINEKNLQKECAEQPGLFAWYSAILADQESRLAAVEIELERCEADVALKLRRGDIKVQSADGKSDVKLTEGAIKEYILQDKKHMTLSDDVQYYENICRRFRSLITASVQRKDMLIQLAGLTRQEMRNFGGPMG